MPRATIGRLVLLAVVAAFAVGVASLADGWGTQISTPAVRRVAEAGSWEGFVGGTRPPVETGQRMIVVLKTPSLASRVAAAGGLASDREERRWTARALAAQRLFISRMRIQGAVIEPEHLYTRVLNGFSAPLDPRAVALLERSPDVEGVYPVRPAFPASVSTHVLERPAYGVRTGRRPETALAGFDGRGVTIALLDTGVERRHPYVRGRILEGIDILDEVGLATPGTNPDDPDEVEEHGTELAGILVGAGGPGDLAGVVTGAAVIPIRVAGWQQDTTGQFAVYARTDQIVAGLERAVDPNGDGDAHDGARVALVGVTERYAAFEDGPLARATAGAMQLDTLVVAPAGNDGPLGPGYGSVGGPGGAPAALTVGAADLRAGFERARVVLRAGLEVLFDEEVPLGGAVAPEHAMTLAPGAPRPPGPPGSAVLRRFFDRGGFSLVARRAAVVRAGAGATAAVEAAAQAGARAVVLYGKQVPAGALGLDARAPLPVVGVPSAAARRLLAAAAAGANTSVSIAPGTAERNEGAPGIAAFSSRGLAFGGRLKPELSATAVELATSEPGVDEDGEPRFATVTGSSVAAAMVAGAAAALAQARPELDAEALKGVLVATAGPLAGATSSAQGGGVVDAGAATSAEAYAAPATLAFGRVTKVGWRQVKLVEVRNLSHRTLRLRVGVERRGFPAAEVVVSARPLRLIIRPGETKRVRVAAVALGTARGGPAADGAVVLAPPAGTPLRIPFAIAFAPPRFPLLRGVQLSEGEFEPSEARPAVLSLVAGLVRTVGGAEEVQPVSKLDIELFTGTGRRIGVIARLRNLLPGRYSFGLTGRDPGGQRLSPGPYGLRVIASPTGGGPPTVRTIDFLIKEPEAPE